MFGKQSWKRGFLEIMAEILEHLKENPLKKTHVTYKCNLDSRAVTKYLSVLSYLELVEPKDSMYRITQKGMKYLEHYNSLVDLMDKSLEDNTIQSQDMKKVIFHLKHRQWSKTKNES